MAMRAIPKVHRWSEVICMSREKHGEGWQRVIEHIEVY